uniref:cAMP-dependent protein kinase inhibitor gamma-like n=1 Tax=Jaculus jaculus TaxID=51337 RepID=UPI000332F771|nr:cAMP-dependent protein kinase inhibitor gamma-like [Jaculus jaculus]
MMAVKSSYLGFISCDQTGCQNTVPDIHGGSEPGKVAGSMGDLALHGAERQVERSTSDEEASSQPES